jgi:hypothetical protein
LAGRVASKVTDTAIKAERSPGRHSDGGGLYHNVSATESKSWLIMWTPTAGKRRETGLGAYPAVSLAKARTLAGHYRALVADGRDPIAERDRLPFIVANTAWFFNAANAGTLQLRFATGT